MSKRLGFHLLQGILFALAGYCLFLWGQFMIYAVGSTDNLLLTRLPFLLFTLLPSFLLLFAHIRYHRASFCGKRITTYVAGGFFALYGLALALPALLFVANKTYSGLVIGNATPWYPLDIIILGFLLFALGLLALGYAQFKMKKPEGAACPRLRGPRPLGILQGILFFLFTYFAAFWFGEFLVAFVAFDRAENHFISLVMFLLFAHPAAMLLLYEAFYRESRSKKFWFVSSLACFGVSAALIATFAIYKSIYGLGFITESLTFAFPLDFATSRNFGPIILIILNAVPPVAALLLYVLRHGGLLRGGKKKQEPASPSKK